MKTYTRKSIKNVDSVLNRVKDQLDISSDTGLAKELGVSKTTLSNWRTRNSMDWEKLFSICEQKGLGLDFTILGDEGKVRSESTVLSTVLDEEAENLQGQNAGFDAGSSEKAKVKKYTDDVHFDVHLSEKEALYKGTFAGTFDGKQLHPIAYYDIEASAGPVEFFNDEAEVPAANIYVPGFDDCDLALNVWGDSMHPEYKAGDIAICRRVNDKRLILYGEAYLVITKEFRAIKYLQPGAEAALIKMVSENDFYQPVEIRRDSILHLYQVKGRVQRNAI